MRSRVNPLVAMELVPQMNKKCKEKEGNDITDTRRDKSKKWNGRSSQQLWNVVRVSKFGIIELC